MIKPTVNTHSKHVRPKESLLAHYFINISQYLPLTEMPNYFTSAVTYSSCGREATYQAILCNGQLKKTDPVQTPPMTFSKTIMMHIPF